MFVETFLSGIVSVTSDEIIYLGGKVDLINTIHQSTFPTSRAFQYFIPRISHGSREKSMTTCFLDADQKFNTP